MAEKTPIGLQEALALTMANIRPLSAQSVALADAVDRIAAEDLVAQVDSPSVDASLKDGYAVVAQSVAAASSAHAVRLKLAGHAAAGGDAAHRILPGTTIRVLTGAAIPEGADAVVSEEFTFREDREVVFTHFAESGRNVMAKGSDVAAGEPIVRAGQILRPGRLGLLAAAGHSRISVVRRPTVAILATGDEVVAPGVPLPAGKLYASNLLALTAWCRRYGMATLPAIVRDDAEALFDTLRTFGPQADAIITSGGAWSGDRDLVAGVLRQLEWRQVFHRIRMGPGKAAGFGMLADKPVFILPGGPPSNLIGFLQIALPGLLKQSGHPHPGLRKISARAAQDLAGRNRDWTHFVFGKLEWQTDPPLFVPLRQRSRLNAMAEATAVAAIPEGCRQIDAGSLLPAQLLD
ncbi:MAG: molybdopterin molybdenumtransferase MoeA [Desulfobacteraceae bacterium]|nr:MAG: molybdopterin molybdenumtransferase MoeA [Desulfobacteraceae bacterium]